MSLTDPIADMLTRIRNGLRNKTHVVNVRGSKVNTGIASVLKEEGYIEDFREIEAVPQGTLRVYLKYGPDDEMVIRSIKRKSKPGLRLYWSAKDLEKNQVLNGLGLAVLSTSRGILSDRTCRKLRIGGEVLCTVW